MRVPPSGMPHHLKKYDVGAAMAQVEDPACGGAHASSVFYQGFRPGL